MNIVKVPSDYVGKIVIARAQYFDARLKKMNIKARPMLIIGAEKDYFPCDYNVLPISRVTNENHRHDCYDLELTDEQCVRLSLNHRPSFIRTHKQTVVSSKDVTDKFISDLKVINYELYQEVIDIHTNFTESLF